MKSIITASMHRGGSTIADKIIGELCKIEGYSVERISDLVSNSDGTERDVFLDYQDKISDVGFYYGVARGLYVKDMHVIPNIRCLIHVRDPRDCITSSYFSISKSHGAPSSELKQKEFKDRRQKVSAMDINDFALRAANQYKERMKVLKDLSENHVDCKVVFYEDMVTNTDKWISDVLHFLSVDVNSFEMSKGLAKLLDFTVKEEDLNKHKRQVSPGDHVRKLEPSTIGSLNKLLTTELEYFGYN